MSRKQPRLPDRLHGGSRLVLDRAAHRVTVGGHGVVLALQEFRLLELLMANADHVRAEHGHPRHALGLAVHR